MKEGTKKKHEGKMGVLNTRSKEAQITVSVPVKHFGEPKNTCERLHRTGIQCSAKTGKLTIISALNILGSYTGLA